MVEVVGYDKAIKIKLEEKFERKEERVQMLKKKY